MCPACAPSSIDGPLRRAVVVLAGVACQRMTLPPDKRAEVQRILDDAARRLLAEHLRDCADEHGAYHFTAKPDKPGESTCDVCGGTFTGVASSA